MRKKSIPFFLFLLCGIYSHAQNVGIGDPAPSAKLSIIGSESTPEGQGAAIKLQNTSSANTWYIRAGGFGTTTPPGGFSFGDNTGYHFTIRPGGNTGLGINLPTARLHVNGSMKLEGLNTLEFGAGIAGKEINAGKIGYDAFGSGALEIVGAGSATANRAVHFFAEGGTTFDGPISIGGSLQINGNPGQAGQVLTSNGTAAAEWANAAYTNNTRFKVQFSTNLLTNDYMDITQTKYNLNTTDVTIGANSITINKEGLYRINGIIESVITYAAATTVSFEPELSAQFQLGGGMTDFVNLVFLDHYYRQNGAGIPTYHFHKIYSIDMHIRAGTTIRVLKSFVVNGTPATSACVVHLYANLIAE